MSIVDAIQELIPMQYRVARVSFQLTDDGLQASWDVRIYNAGGRELQAVHPASQPDATLRAALASWYNDSRIAFETATGLTEYIPLDIP